MVDGCSGQDFAGKLHLVVEPTASSMRDKGSLRLCFFRMKQTAAQPATLGRILQLQNQDIMPLSETLDGGNSRGIMQIADDDDQRPRHYESCQLIETLTQ